VVQIDPHRSSVQLLQGVRRARASTLR
jgi:hypothetical protein